MGILKRAADIAYTFRFIRMLVMDWKDWDAYKLGIIDENGKRDRNVKLDSDEKKSAYTTFIRLAANVKRLVAKIPGGSPREKRLAYISRVWSGFCFPKRPAPVQCYFFVRNTNVRI